MGGKHSKREAAHGSTSPRESSSSKVTRSRSLPTRVFARRLIYDHGGSFRGRPLLEEPENQSHIDEYQRLIDLEKLHGKENAGFCSGTSQDIIRSCISPRGSNEEIIYEDGVEDNVGDETCIGPDVKDLRESFPLSRTLGRSRLSAYSATSFAALVRESEAADGVDPSREPRLVGSSLSSITSPNVEKAQELDSYLVDQCADTEVQQLNPCLWQLSTEPADNVQETEPTLSNQASLPPEEELTNDELDPQICEKSTDSLLEADTKKDQARVSGSDPEDLEEYLSEASLSGVPKGTSDYKFQAQDLCREHRYRRRRRNLGCGQEQEKAGVHIPDIEEVEKMSRKGKVSLSFSNSGKRQKEPWRKSFSDGSDVVWGTSPGKRIKDGVDEECPPSDLHPDAFAWGLMGQSDPFVGLDAAGFLSQLPGEDEQMKGNFTRRSRTPIKVSRSRALARKVRNLRASPKPVSSLESCLRAQLLDESDRGGARRVSRPLNFLSPADGRGEYLNMNMKGYANGAPTSPNMTPRKYIAVKGEERISKTVPTAGSTGLPGLPNLQSLLKGYAAKLAGNKDDRSSTSGTSAGNGVVNDQQLAGPGDGWWMKALLPVVLKKQKLSHTEQVSLAASDPASDTRNSEETVVGSMEGLLFSYGVGIGMLYMANTNKADVEMMSHLLHETRAQVQNLKLELERMGGTIVMRKLHVSAAGEKFERVLNSDGGNVSIESRDASHGAVNEDLESLRSIGTFRGSLNEGDQMAELEAELEAELDQLTGFDSMMDSQYSVLDELDMDGVASVVHGDLSVIGLPARVDDTDDDDYSAPAQPGYSNNFAVSPRELARLLRKLQATRQQEQLTDLEEELEAMQSKLQTKEKELEVWKDRVLRLNTVTDSSGDESLNLKATTGAVAPFEHPGILIDKNAAASGSDILQDQESVPLEGVGAVPRNILSDKSPAWSEVSGGSSPAAALEDVETRDMLHTQAAEQKYKHNDKENSQVINSLAGNDSCNEFLWSLIDGAVEVPAQVELDVQSSKDCKPVLDNAQIEKQLINSVKDMETPEFADILDMGSDYSSTLSMADAWIHPSEATLQTNNGDTGVWVHRAKLPVPHPSRRTSWNSQAGNVVLVREPDSTEPLSAKANRRTSHVYYADPLKSSKSVSELSDAETADHRTNDTPYSGHYVDNKGQKCTVSAKHLKPLCWEGTGQAGLNTPVEKVRQQLFKTPLESLDSKQPQYLERRPEELSPTVLDKIIRWEGLMEGETPGPSIGYDWECQSRASEAEQQCIVDSEYDDIGVFGEENLVSEAEEMLGQMLISRIVEKTRRGSHIVKEAQSALATLEKADRGGSAVSNIMNETEFTEWRAPNQFTPSEKGYDSGEGWSDDQGKLPTGFVDEAVCKEYEFFRRLELINKDRRAVKAVKGSFGQEPIYLGRFDVGSIPEPHLSSSLQLTHGIGRNQSKEPVKEGSEEGSIGLENGERPEAWLKRGKGHQESYGRSGYREDEVRSRRRSGR